ncbi:MAG: hypothetical protein R3E57_04800 [Porticoccaceae bacterium]
MSIMRWLFWTLLMFNGVAAYWFSASAQQRVDLESTGRAADIMARGSGAAQLELLSEKPPKLKDSQDVSSAQGGRETAEREAYSAVPLSESREADETTHCVLIGPLATAREQHQLEKLLSERVQEMQVENHDEVVREDFWLLFPPGMPEVVMTELLVELHGKKIESFIIGSGEYKGGITLGVFTEKENADKYRSSLQSQGYEPFLAMKPRVKQTSWLNVKTNAGVEDVVDWVRDGVEVGLVV